MQPPPPPDAQYGSGGYPSGMPPQGMSQGQYFDYGQGHMQYSYEGYGGPEQQWYHQQQQQQQQPDYYPTNDAANLPQHYGYDLNYQQHVLPAYGYLQQQYNQNPYGQYPQQQPPHPGQYPPPPPPFVPSAGQAPPPPPPADIAHFDHMHSPPPPPPPPGAPHGHFMEGPQHAPPPLMHHGPPGGPPVHIAPREIALPAPIQKIVDARDLFLEPGRRKRAERICIILRGLPGSGKSHVAKLIRDVEKEHNVSCRVHCLDDYFLTEVVRQEKDENGVTQNVVKMDYIYEPDMEPVYMQSHFKAFKKTLDDLLWKVIVADSINVRKGHFEEFWKAAKDKKCEVYVAELDNDVKKCVARNVHGWTQEALERMLQDWEKTPGHMTALDLKPLLGDKAIEEVEMEDEEHDTQHVDTGDHSSHGQQEGHTHAAPQGKGGTGPGLASEASRGLTRDLDASEVPPPPPKEYEGGVPRKRGAESPSESVPSKSRWESDDDDDDSSGDEQPPSSSRASSRPKITHHDEDEKQPPARSVKKHVHWGTPEVHMAIFDQGDGIGFIRKEAAAQGGFELSAVAMLRQQERKKTVDSSQTHQIFLQKMHEEQRAFKDLRKKFRVSRFDDLPAEAIPAPPPTPPVGPIKASRWG